MIIYLHKCMDGEVPLPNSFQRVGVWCKPIGMVADGRPGARFLKVSREVRVCPLQLLSARKGIQVVPRILFALSMMLGAFFIL